MIQFPYPLVECRGDEALARWAELRESGKKEGYYPIIIGNSEDAENLAESLEENDAEPSEILAAAASLNGDDVLRHRLELEQELTDEVEIGEWPEWPTHQDIVTHTEMGSGKPKTTVFIAKIPTIHSWEVPAYLRYGGWNDCPGPEEHVAVHRMWNERYGAEIIAVTGDVVECVVSRPPNTRDDAMALAKQQFYYCTDIVFQGVETLSALAGGLLDHDAWFFWWD